MVRGSRLYPAGLPGQYLLTSFLWIIVLSAGWLETHRTQIVRANGELSELSVTVTGSPQECALSPRMYIMYTKDCRSTYEKRHILKFADDTVRVSLPDRDEFSHGPVVDYFMTCCQDSFLTINASKTKDMVIDFRHSQSSAVNTVINGQNHGLVDSYEYLGTIFD